MLLLFIYRNISTSRFSGLFLVFILVLFPCARAGLSSPLLIEAGVDDLFPRWNPHSFALITLAVYAHSHDILSPEPAHLAGPSAHTRSRLTTINFTHPPQFSSLCSKPSQSLIWTLISMLYNFSHHCCIRAPPPRTQCFLSSSCRRFCCLLTYITNAPPCNSCTLKDKTKSNKERSNQRYRRMSFGLDISSHHQFTGLERTASRNGDIAFAIGRNDL